MFTQILKILVLLNLVAFPSCSTTNEKSEISPSIILENYGQIEGDDGISRLDVRSH